MPKEWIKAYREIMISFGGTPDEILESSLTPFDQAEMDLIEQGVLEDCGRYEAILDL